MTVEYKLYYIIMIIMYIYNVQHFIYFYKGVYALIIIHEIRIIF